MRPFAAMVGKADAANPKKAARERVRANTRNEVASFIFIFFHLQEKVDGQKEFEKISSFSSRFALFVAAIILNIAANFPLR